MAVSESSQDMIEAIFTGLIIFTIGLEVCLKWVEEKCRKHKHLTTMLHLVYKELMILGIVAFVLFLIESSGTSLSEDHEHLFHAVHMHIFLLSLLFLVAVMFLMVVSVRIGRHWEVMEQDDFKSWLVIKKKYKAMRKIKLEKGWVWSHLNIPFWYEHARVQLRTKFHDLRNHFIHSNHLAHDFRFASYLRKCKQHIFLELVELHHVAWSAIMFLALVELYVRNTWSFSIIDDDHIHWAFLVAGIAMSFSAVIIFVKCRRIFTILMHSDLIDFDPYKAAKMHGHRHSFVDKIMGTSNHNPTRLVLKVDTSGSEYSTLQSASDSDHEGRVLQWLDEEASVPRLDFDNDVIEKKDPSVGYSIQNWGDSSNSRHMHLENQKKLFWLHSPTLILRLMQILLLLVVFMIAVLIQNGKHLLHDLGGYQFGVSFVGTFLAFAFTTYFLSHSIPVYTFVMHVGQFVDVEIVKAAKEKGKKKVKVETSETESSSFIASEDSQGIPLTGKEKWKYNASRFVLSRKWRTFLVVLISGEIIITSFASVDSVMNTDGVDEFFWAYEIFNSMMLCLDQGLRGFAFGIGYFYDKEAFLHVRWNQLDLLVSVVSLVLSLLHPIMPNGVKVEAWIRRIRMYHVVVVKQDRTGFLPEKAVEQVTEPSSARLFVRSKSQMDPKLAGESLRHRHAHKRHDAGSESDYSD